MIGRTSPVIKASRARKVPVIIVWPIYGKPAQSGFGSNQAGISLRAGQRKSVDDGTQSQFRPENRSGQAHEHTLLSSETISREASDKTKGFRLQKVRAIKLMLDTLGNQDNAIFYTAIEDGEDVSHSTVSGEEARKYYEEDKNYSSDHKFTVFSPEVKNTLVSFFDLYVNTWGSSEEVSLGFYTTASIGKEKKSFNVDGAEVAPPAEPILLSLSAAANILSDAIAMMVKSVLVEEYQKQYSSRSSGGHSKTLDSMPIKDFKLFLAKITWHFGDEDEVALKQTVMHLICDSRFHNVRLAGKEESVFCILMEMLDERQHKQSLVSRVVSASDVELVFKKAESEEDDSLMDPTWSEYRKLEQQITDKRNLEEKVLSVCPEYPPKKLQFLARLACRAKSEQLASNRSFLSLKYRVYEACTEQLFKEVDSTDSESGIDEVFERLKSLSSEHVSELKSDYKYTISNKHTVSGVVMDLFDGCFMSFDEVSNEE